MHLLFIKFPLLRSELFNLFYILFYCFYRLSYQGSLFYCFFLTDLQLLCNLDTNNLQVIWLTGVFFQSVVCLHFL